MAGTAIENSMLGAAHSAANPLTARFGIVHGQAVGMVLPAVIAFNAQLPEAQAQYLALAAVAGRLTLARLRRPVTSCSANAFKRLMREETIAISDMANRPFTTIRKPTAAISMANMG